MVSAVVAWLASLPGNSSGSAFARMMELVDNARTVAFTTTIDMPRASHRMESKTMMLEPDWIREEMFEGKERHATILIQNIAQRKSLSLMPAEKKAVMRSMTTPSGARPKNFIEQLREVREGSAELLGNEKINGKDTHKYRCNHPTAHYLIWVSSDSGLPARVEMSETAAGAGDVKITLSDFQWNMPLDETLFTLDVPKGYALEEEAAPVNALDPTNFITTMKVYVRLNNNQFPDAYNALSTGAMMRFLVDLSLPEAEREANARRKLFEALGHPEWEKLSGDERKKWVREISRTFAQGAVFLQILSQTHEWHYVGKGVNLGEADKIVAWWAPKAIDKTKDSDPSQTATVLYGDFHTDTKPSAGLTRDGK